MKGGVMCVCLDNKTETETSFKSGYNNIERKVLNSDLLHQQL